MKKHTLELWPYVRGIKPHEAELYRENSMRRVGTEPLLEGFHEEILAAVTEDMTQDAEAVWQESLRRNPKLTNGYLINLKTVSSDGRQLHTNFSNYKTTLWIKKRLSEYPIEQQEAITKRLAQVNIGMVTVTSDNRILLEQRLPNVVAGEMLLTYPCGNSEREDRSLEDAVNSEAREELGFPLTYGNGKLYDYVHDLYSIGMERESDEWSFNYVFLNKLKLPSTTIRPTHEVRTIVTIPAEPKQLIEKIAELYSPTIKGTNPSKLVPNATCMLSLFIKETAGKKSYDNLIDRLSEIEKKKHTTELEVREYTPSTNPFQ